MALTYNQSRSDTIAAISTAVSDAGIGIVRVSGPEVFSIVQKIFRNHSGKCEIASWKANTIHHGFIHALSDPSDITDEVLISIMKAPHSYTTEDTIEINTHGGVYVIQKVLETVLAAGARLAEPGEFTKRAFLGGRIDLSRAEAVMDLISSRNEFARRSALSQLEGSVADKISDIRSKILYQTAFIESALDDPENYSTEGYPQKLQKICQDLINELNSMIDFSRNGRMLKEGIRTVIVGKPNAGKSSLLNYLSGTDRAIVTEIAGTTRDTLEETVRVGEVILNITDTAGIHDTDDKVEQIGIEKARKALDQADLILFVLDSEAGINDEDRAIARMIMKRIQTGARCIVLLNKSDLPSHIAREDAQDLFRFSGVISNNQDRTQEKCSTWNISVPSTQGENTPASLSQDDLKHMPVNYRKIAFISSALTTGEGLSELRDRINTMFRTGQIMASNEVFLSNMRQIQCCQDAVLSLQRVLDSIDKQMGIDFYSIDLQDAYTSLGKILGESVEDDLVEEIFSRFCMGK